MRNVWGIEKIGEGECGLEEAQAHDGDRDSSLGLKALHGLFEFALDRSKPKWLWIPNTEYRKLMYPKFINL